MHTHNEHMMMLMSKSRHLMSHVWNPEITKFKALWCSKDNNVNYVIMQKYKTHLYCSNVKGILCLKHFQGHVQVTTANASLFALT